MACGKNPEDIIAVSSPTGSVTIHADADPNTEKFGTLMNFVNVERGDSPGRLYGSSETRQACLDACNALVDDPDTHWDGSTAEGKTIQACFDNDAIWWSVLLRDGSTGFASAKYLH